jgi:hypothetical protein
MSLSKIRQRNYIPFCPHFIVSKGLNLDKVRQLKSYFMATHRGVVQDIMSYVVYHAVHDRAIYYFETSGIPRDDYDIQLNKDFLEIYCESPPRAHYPNVNARFKLRDIISAFNHEEASTKYRIFWLGTPAYEVWNKPLRIRSPEEYDGLPLMFNFDFYWNLVVKFFDMLNQGKEVTEKMVKSEVSLYGQLLHEPKMDIEKQPPESVEEPVSPILIH